MGELFDGGHGEAHPEDTKNPLSLKPAPARIKRDELVSIIIPVFNNADFTCKCLAAVKKNTAGCNYEIIVIDNASTDETQSFLKSCDLENVTVINNRENVGFTKACNQGAQRARGEFVLFLNNDTEPQPGWLDALLDLMRSDDLIGIAGCKLVYPDGRLQEAGGIVFNDGSGWNYGRLEHPDNPLYCYVREVDYVSGAALLVRHDLLRRLCYLDEQYSPGYYEDTDLCFGARSLGYKVMYCPLSIVVHHEGASSGTDLSRGMKQYQVVNKQKFLEKWGCTIKQQYPPGSSITMASSRHIAGNVLIIYYSLPLFDRNSGSLRLFSMIGMLRQQGYHVTYISTCGHPQAQRYIRILQSMGVEVYLAADPAKTDKLMSPVDGRPMGLKQLLASRDYSVAFLSPYAIARLYLSAVRALSPLTRIAIDTVDIHFLRHMREAELSQDPVAMEQAESIKEAELGIYHQADALITVTEQDWQHIEAYLPAKPHFVIPNIHSIPDDRGCSPDRTGLLFIGGFCHPPNTDAVLYFVKEIFPLVKKTVPDVTLMVVGDNPPDSILELADDDITVTGYVPSTEPYLQKARVSIAPLRYGAGMKGKIGEAMAHGLPVVTTSVGAEGIGLVHAETALIADTPEEFAKHVVRLCSDSSFWSTISENARLFIEHNYSPQVVSSSVHDIMDRLAEIDPPGAKLFNRIIAFASRLRRPLTPNISWKNYDNAYYLWKQYKKGNVERHHALQVIDDKCNVRLFFLLYPFYKTVNPFRKLARKLSGEKRNQPTSPAAAHKCASSDVIK
jgi:O-antigen biosynthesis protein